MLNNKNDQMEQYFADEEQEEHQNDQHNTMKIEFRHKIIHQLPAKQLITARRPKNMFPRTLFLDRPLYILRNQLNQPCIERCLQPVVGKLKLKIANKKNLSLEQYFETKKYKSLYNKLQTYKFRKSFNGKLRQMGNLIDYDWKAFKQLQFEINLLEDRQKDELDSDFEAGNMCRAYEHFEDEKDYYLIIQNDINTYGYNNWFFFRLRNAGKGIRRFNIVNIIKNTLFFTQGMMISIFSVAKNRKEGINWFKAGNQISFNQINFTRNHHSNDYYWCLSFQYNCEEENDQIYFALNQPYTYSRCITECEKLVKNVTHLKIQMKSIGFTVANNLIPVLHFSNQSNIQKEIILILARQHPCEAVGSFKVEALMKIICEKEDSISSYLIQKFDFVVIPMVNPDGVIHGTSRCNIGGMDLNRQWGSKALKQLTPETIKINNYLLNLTKTRKIKYMIDLHGHGKKLNCFFFACKANQKQHYRLLSMAMNKLQPRFNISSCTYGITKQKENTIRSKINSMGINQSYTLQSSLYGWKNDKNQIRPYNQSDYHQIAQSLIHGIFAIEAEQQIALKLLGLNRKMLYQQIQSQIDIIQKDEELNCHNKEMLSDSDPDADRLELDQILGKVDNKRLKTRIEQSANKKKSIKPKRGSSAIKTGYRTNQNKQIRQSCPSDLHVKRKAESIFENQGSLKQKLIHSDMACQKKSTFTQKWITKRKIIIEKLRREQLEKELIDNPIATQTHKINQQKRIVASKSVLSSTAYTVNEQTKKRRKISSKLKTEFIQVEELTSVEHIDKAKQIEDKKQIQLKLNELKRQNLCMLLTDALSIQKIANNKKRSDNQQAVKNINLEKKNSYFSMINTKAYLKTEEAQPNVYRQKQSRKYKKFHQFRKNKVEEIKTEQKHSSVFYYFPIL